MELTPGYKQSDSGVIPEDWECLPISELARLESGHTPSRRVARYWNGNVPWISLHDTDALDGNEIHTTAKTITRAGLDNSSARLLPAGTVVFSRTATIGKASIMGRSMATSQDFANYICGPRLHNQYLMYLLRSMRAKWQQLMAGSIHNTIYMPAFERLKIVCPPVAEQRAIAEALADGDRAIAASEALVVKRRAVKQAVMQQLLTGVARLPGFHAEWEPRTIGEIANIHNGATPRTGIALYWDGSIPWCTPTDITSTSGKYLAYTERTITPRGLSSCAAVLLPAGALLLCTRATIGDVKIAAVPVATNQGFKSLVCKIGCSNEFLYYLLLTLKPRMVERSNGSTFLELSKGQLAGIEVRLPPLDEQRAIAAILSDMDAEIEALERQRDKLVMITQGMMQQLLTGRIRFVAPQPAGSAA